MRLRTRRTTTAVVALIVGLAAPPLALAAAGPQSGVHLDPGSPVAKQYSIPLSVARGAPPGSSGQGKLFGSGITSSPKSSGTTPAASSTAAAASTPVRSSTPAASKISKVGPRGKSTALAHRSTADHAVNGTPSAYTTLRSGSGAGIAVMALLALAVLVLGGVGAYALTVRGRRGSPT